MKTNKQVFVSKDGRCEIDLGEKKALNGSKQQLSCLCDDRRAAAGRRWVTSTKTFLFLSLTVEEITVDYEDLVKKIIAID